MSKSELKRIAIQRADAQSFLTDELAAGRELCPDCGRMKARNADDCCAGDCSKWYAIRDLECRQECEEIAAQKAANGTELTGTL